MFKKIIKGVMKEVVKSKIHGKHYSSSHMKKHYGHSSSYGHGYYKKKHKLGGLFKSYSSRS